MSLLKSLLNYSQQVDEVRAKIKQLLPRLSEARFRARNFTELDDINRRLSAIEVELMYEISNEVDANTGKPKYSNETKRKAELKTRLESHPEYQELRNRLRELKQEKVEAELEYESLRDEYRALLAEASLLSAEANLMS